MKVILTRTNPVSPEPPVEKIAAELVALGHEVTVIGWGRETGNCREQIVKVSSTTSYRVVRVGRQAKYGIGLKNLLPYFGFLSCLWAWLYSNRREIEIIHAFDFDTGWLVSIFASFFKKKMVYHILDYYSDTHFTNRPKLRKLIAWFENKIINNADCTIICSEKRKKQIAGSTPRNLLVIHNTPSFFPKDQKIIKCSSSRLRIVYVGVLVQNRLIEDLLEFVANHPKFEIHIAGFGALEPYIRNYSEKNDNIFFYGKLSYDVALALEQQCDIMTALYDPSVPNHKYAAPNKFYEAMYLGKPLIVVQDTAIDQYVHEYDLGEVIRYTKEDLNKALLSLASRSKEWQDIGKRARCLYDRQFSWDTMALRIKKLYTSFEK